MSSPPTSDVGFVQQGQVDWVSLGKTVVPLTVDVLARLQGAGVQAITYAGALQLCTCFKLPQLGRQRLWDAIQRLPVYNGPSNLLYFGLGHRSFFRILTETVSGLKCIALCSCLAEMHTESVAAGILSAIWHEVGYPEDYEPSIIQFRALVKSCGGALATSPFPELVSRMLPPDASLQGHIYCSEPKDVAKALTGLFDISMGMKKSITVVGGYDCAFISAVAHWIFNLEVYVEDQNGNVIFSSSVAKRPLQPGSAQVYVRYGGADPQAGMVISQSTYVLNDPKDLLLYTPDKKLLRLRRRVRWDCCLSETFGQAFEDLKSLEMALGQFLGAFARISLALADGQVNIGDQRREEFIDFAEASYGAGFVASARSVFSELSSPGLHRIMQSILSKSFDQAQSQFDEAILTFKRQCLCSMCTNNFDNPTYDCLLVLAAALVDLISTVSTILFESEHALEPTFEGLRSFYERSVNHIQRSEGPMTERWHSLFHRWRKSYDGNLYPPMNQLGILLEEALFLFTGANSDGGESVYHADLPAKPRSAVCASGICVFIEGMISMSTRADLLRRIHVIPGRIGRSNPASLSSVPREYDSVLDVIKWPKSTLQSLQIEPPSRADSVLGESEGEMELESRQELPTQHGNHRLDLTDLKMTAEVAESGDAGEITFFYRISTADGDIIVPPGKVTMGVLRYTGLIACDRSRCSTGPSDLTKLYTVKAGWHLDDSKADEMDLPMTMCLDWGYVRNSEIGRLAAFAVQHQMADYLVRYHDQVPNRIVLRRRECVQCCVQSADRMQKLLKEKGKLHQGGIARIIFHFI